MCEYIFLMILFILCVYTSHFLFLGDAFPVTVCVVEQTTNKTIQCITGPSWPRRDLFHSYPNFQRCKWR